MLPIIVGNYLALLKFMRHSAFMLYSATAVFLPRIVVLGMLLLSCFDLTFRLSNVNFSHSHYMKYTLGTSRPRSSCIGVNWCSLLLAGMCTARVLKLLQMAVDPVTSDLTIAKPTGFPRREFDLGLWSGVRRMPVVQ